MKRTELKAVVAYGIYTLLGNFGASPETVNEASSFIDKLITQFSQGESISSIVLGAVVAIYVWSRTKRKNIKTIMETKGKIWEGTRGNPQGRHNKTM
jgi:hypothetical protein